TYGLRLDVPTFPDQPRSNPDAQSAFSVNTQDVPSGNLLWSPRVGFNYDVTGDRRTVLRGGVGLFTGRPAYVWLSNAYGNSGRETVQLSCVNVAGRADSVPAFTLDPNNQPSLCRTRPSLTATGLQTANYFDKDFKFPQVWKVDVAVDRDLPHGFLGTFEVHGDVDLPDLRELEILVEVVHGLQASRGQRRLVPAQGRLVVRIQREGGNGVRSARHVDAAQLHRLPPRVAIGVGQPYVGRPAREQADAAAQHGPAVSRDVIVEAHTRRPQQVSGRDVLRVHAESALRVGVGARLVREGRNVEAQAVGQVQPRRRVPLVLDVEPELADPEIGDRRGRPGIRQRARERGRAPGLEGRKACERPQPRELPDEQVLEVEELVVRSQRELVPSLEPEGY